MFFFLLRMHLVSSVFRDQTKVIDAKDWSIQMNVHGVNTPNKNNKKKKKNWNMRTSYICLQR